MTPVMPALLPARRSEKETPLHHAILSPRRCALIACLAAAVSATALAQTAPAPYPAKPIRLIVPYPPGGANDIIGRHVADQMAERLGKPWVIDNRGGAGGIIGISTAANAQPDGHTLLLVAVFFAISPAIHKLDYDPVKSFERVAMIGTSSAVLAINPSLGINSVKELVAAAKAKPGQLSYGSAGVGSFSHFSAELLNSMAGIKTIHVPYKGAAASMLDVIAGRTTWLTGSPNQFLQHFKTGRLKPLATGGAKRMAILPELPTISEAGVPGYVADNWWGILAPAKTPQAIIQKLNAETDLVVKLPATRERLMAEGIEPASLTPQAFTQLIVTDIAKWRKVAKDADIRNE